MAGWDEILKELNETMSQTDFVRSFLYDSNIGTRKKAGERKDTSL